MKKILAVLLTLAMVFALAACRAQSQPAPTEAPTEASTQTPTEAATEAPTQAEPAARRELIVFAAASLTETLTEIESKYEAAHEDVDLVFTFDSSGTLKTQIAEGAPCDVFLSAAPKQMNQLDGSKDAEANPEGLDLVAQGSRVDLLENKVALCVAQGKTAIASYDELAQALQEGTVLLAVGNSDVPVGQYTQKIFAYYGLEENAIASCLTYGSNVKEVTTAVVEATADCGIIYATDAFSAGLTPVDTATAEMCGRVIYPAAVLNTSAHPQEAQAFLDYLQGEEASAVFASVGFTPLNG